MTRPELRVGPWRLAELDAVPRNGLRVLSTFSCGGGSTMGYKLAGFDMVGCCDIDPQMIAIYNANHRPKMVFDHGVRAMIDDPRIATLPELDVLDGSPPCSSFSMAGARERKWGKSRKFREGQVDQVLDDLFFSFISLAAKLRPKVVVAENVKGLIAGNAKGYVVDIFRQLREAGYDAQLFLLNASRMGVPQRRERTFFLARRRDLGLKPISLSFREAEITFADAVRTKISSTSTYKSTGRKPGPAIEAAWRQCALGESLSSVRDGAMFNWVRISPNRPIPTLTATACILHNAEPRRLDVGEVIRCQTFPDDYDFLDADPTYVCGMSVPPFMMQRVADQIAWQWFNR